MATIKTFLGSTTPNRTPRDMKIVLGLQDVQRGVVPGDVFRSRFEKDHLVGNTFHNGTFKDEYSDLRGRIEASDVSEGFGHNHRSFAENGTFGASNKLDALALRVSPHSSHAQLDSFMGRLYNQVASLADDVESGYIKRKILAAIEDGRVADGLTRENG